MVLVHDVGRLHCRVEVLLYADDILLMVPGSNRRLKGDIQAVMYVLAVFGRFSGLRVNAAKTYVLVKQSVGEPPTSVAGFAVKESLRYLGALLGHLTPTQAYGPIVAKLMLHAHYVVTLPLTLREKAEILKIWIAPCCYLVARVHDLTPAVVRLLNVV